MTKGGTECLPTINYGDYCICAVSGVSKATLLLVSLISHTVFFHPHITYILLVLSWSLPTIISTAEKSLRPCLAGLPLASALLKEPELF